MSHNDVCPKPFRLRPYPALASRTPTGRHPTTRLSVLQTMCWGQGPATGRLTEQTVEPHGSRPVRRRLVPAGPWGALLLGAARE